MKLFSHTAATGVGFGFGGEVGREMARGVINSVNKLVDSPLKSKRAQGVRADTLVAEGYSWKILYEQAGYTERELKIAGATASDLLAAGVSLESLKEVGYTYRDMKTTGANDGDLKAAGFDMGNSWLCCIK